jgi:hypothetical protein
MVKADSLDMRTRKLFFFGMANILPDIYVENDGSEACDTF